MLRFSFYAPVALHVGRHVIRDSEELLRSYGRRAFIITSRFAPKCPNLALEDMTAALGRCAIRCTVDEQVEENPSVESVVRMTDAIRDFAPDFLVAIGGGSALDTAKAANVLLAYPQGYDAYRAFYEGEMAETGSPSAGVLPLLGVPTTAGSGSEVAGYAVLTRRDLGTKLRMNQLSFFSDAFLDARYIERSPQWLLDAGALDALAHGLEGYFNTASNPTNQMLADAGFELFREFKDDLLLCRLQGEDFDRMLLAATLQGMAVMQSSTTLPHVMGYPMTHDKGLIHGLASCLCLAEYLRRFKKEGYRETVRTVLKKCGFSSVDQLSDYLAAIISRNGAPIPEPEELERWTDEVFANRERLARHPEVLSREELLQIYRRSVEALARHSARPARDAI